MRLRYTLPALANLASILDYIADRSPQGAARIHTRIRAVTDLLLRVSNKDFRFIVGRDTRLRRR
jgi:plasmid stabilization system protein ParE